MVHASMAFGVHECRLAGRSSSVAFRAVSMANEVDRLATGHFRKEAPEPLTIYKVGETTARGCLAEACERAKGNILLVGFATPLARKVRCSDLAELRKVSIPDRPHCLFVLLFDPL